MTSDTEFLDIVDSNNNIIGQASRLEIHANHLLHRSAHIFITFQDYVFLQLRASTKAQFPNTWDTSAAGHLAVGENYHQGATRELEEELGLKLALDQQLRELANIGPSEDNGYEFVKVYAFNFASLPDLKLCPQEITTGGWFSKDQINHWLAKHPENFAGGFDLMWTLICPTL